MTDQAQELKELDAIRTKIAGLKDARESVDNASPPAKILIDNKLMQIDQLTDRLCSKETDIGGLVLPHEIAMLFVVIHSEALKKIIADRIRITIGKNGMTAETKALRLAEIDSEIIALERQEEKLCMKLETVGTPIVRRGDLNPAVFFQA